MCLSRRKLVICLSLESRTISTAFIQRHPPRGNQQANRHPPKRHDRQNGQAANQLDGKALTQHITAPHCTACDAAPHHKPRGKNATAKHSTAQRKSTQHNTPRGNAAATAKQLHDTLNTHTHKIVIKAGTHKDNAGEHNIAAYTTSNWPKKQRMFFGRESLRK